MKRLLAPLVLGSILLGRSRLGAVEIPCAPSPLARVAVEADGLRVVEPHVEQLRAGDILVQLNGQRLRTCAELERALDEARERQLAVLVLVLRGDKTAAVTVEKWGAEAALATATSTIAPATPTSTAAPSATAARAAQLPAASAAPPVVIAPSAPAPTLAPTLPAPRPAEESAATRASAADALRFGRRLREAIPLSGPQGWAADLATILQAHERRRAAAPEAASVDPVFAYYSTALEIAAYKQEQMREAHSTVARAGAIFDYGSTSPIAAWLERYPFLSEAIVQRPEKLTVIVAAESPGRWMPDRAVELLVDRAIAQCEALGR